LDASGFYGAIVADVESRKILAGHTRKRALLAEGETHAPLVVWVRTDDPDHARRVLLADNRTNRVGYDDPVRLVEMLTAQAETAEGLRGTGWDADDLDAIIAEQQQMVGDMVPDSRATVSGPSLADRFVVPPFSVLDARQGYWQDRKRQWLGLGIRSELGRGDSLIGISDQAASHYGRAPGPHPGGGGDAWLNTGGKPYDPKYASPGGSRRPAATLGPDGKTVRGDGAGRPVPGPARAFAQDLMRGEHTLGGDRLTWVPGSGVPGDETSRKNLAGGRRMGARPPHGPNVTQNADGTLHYNPTNNGSDAPGSSVFDPVLCELAYRWFSPPDGRVLDPFAGGSVRGIVAAVLGRSYVGVDLSGRQLEANRDQLDIVPDGDVVWIEGDSVDIAALAPGEYDLVFSCPPYADLERYSDDPRDISTMDYAAFLEAYRSIVAASVAMLRPDRFACFCVGDVRDRRGVYRNFVAHTTEAFQAAGCDLYNEAVLVTAVGSLSIRAGRQFAGGRKLGKAHQNVLVFVKGDAAAAVEACGEVEVPDPAELFGVFSPVGDDDPAA
jgi:DNA modification methylase